MNIPSFATSLFPASSSMTERLHLRCVHPDWLVTKQLDKSTSRNWICSFWIWDIKSLLRVRYYEAIHSLNTSLGTPCKYLIKWLVCVCGLDLLNSEMYFLCNSSLQPMVFVRVNIYWSVTSSVWGWFSAYPKKIGRFLKYLLESFPLFKWTIDRKCWKLIKSLHVQLAAIWNWGRSIKWDQNANCEEADRSRVYSTSLLWRTAPPISSGTFNWDMMTLRLASLEGQLAAEWKRNKVKKAKWQAERPQPSTPTY